MSDPARLVACLTTICTRLECLRAFLPEWGGCGTRGKLGEWVRLRRKALQATHVRDLHCRSIPEPETIVQRALVVAATVVVVSVVAGALALGAYRTSGATSAGTTTAPDRHIPAWLKSVDAVEGSVVSPWMARESGLATAALGRAAPMLVVAPPSTPIVDGVDATVREMVQRRLVAHLVDTATPPADPDLVRQALNRFPRAMPLEAVNDLAASAGATTTLTGQVSVDPIARTVTLVLRRHDRRDGKWVAFEHGSSRRVAFHDRLPPEQALQPALPEMLVELGFKPAAPRMVADSAASLDPARTPPRALAEQGAASAVDAALALQLFAAFEQDLAHERRWLLQRSLIVLDTVGPEDPLAHALRARAFFQLDRRPYARSLLDARTDPAATAVRDYAWANLQRLEEGAARVASPGLRMLLVLDAEQLRWITDREDGFQKRRATFAERYPAYALLSWANISRPEWDHGDVIAGVARELGSFQERPRLPALLELAASRLGVGAPNTIGGLSRTVESQREAFWKSLERPHLAYRSADLRAADYWEALFRAYRSAAFRTVNVRVSAQGRPDMALLEVAELDPVYGGHMELEQWRAKALFPRPGEPDAQLRQLRAVELARAVVLWHGAENHVTTSDPFHAAFYPVAPLPPADEPPFPSRLIWHAVRSQTMAQARLAPIEPGRLDAVRRAADYSHESPMALERLVMLLERTGDRKGADTARAQLQQRFAGLPVADASASDAAGSTDAAGRMARLESAIKARPDSVESYRALALEHADQGRLRDAQKVMLRFFDANRTPSNRVALSHALGDAALWMYFIGEGELSRPLMKNTLSVSTGSASEMLAATFLEMLDARWEGVRTSAETAINRYRLPQSAGHWVMAVGMLGDIRSEEKAFGELHKLVAPDQLWPFWRLLPIGYRRLGVPNTELFDLHTRIPAHPQGGHEDRTARAVGLFGAVYLDRRPSAQETAALRRQLSSSGINLPLWRNHLALADGYEAFVRGDFGGAIPPLRALSEELLAEQARAESGLVNYVLPYLVIALERTGAPGEADRRLEMHRAALGEDFIHRLSRAALQGMRGRHDEALESLKTAWFRKPWHARNAIVPEYAYFEVAEFLFETTRDARYRVLLAERSQKYQTVWPVSWAFSFTALHASDPAVRKQALERATALDRQSHRVSLAGKR
ncbi:MAG: hypothetical protein LXA50_15305 [Betaproteobacteria bacterium]|nr:hypothetical protein [Betaproteobacteria bacterium]